MKSTLRVMWVVAATWLLTMGGCSKNADSQLANSDSSSGGGTNPASISRPAGLGGGGAPASLPEATSSSASTAPTSSEETPQANSAPKSSPSPYGGGFPQSGGGPPSGGGNPYAGTNFPQSGPGGPPSGGPSGYPGMSSGGRPGLAGGGGGFGNEANAPTITAGNIGAGSVYETRVKPILEKNCYQCHRGSQAKAKLQLDSPDGIRKGGEHGPILVAGDPDNSPVVAMIKHESERPMPPKNRLGEEDVTTIVNWIRDGAVMPEGGASPTPPEVLELGFQERATRSFQHGHEEDAIRLAQAYILSTEQPGELYLEQMRWSNIRKRPVFASRVAIGVDLDAPSDLTDYRPIGSTQDTPTGGRGFTEGGMTLAPPVRGTTPGSNNNSQTMTGLKTLHSTTGEMGRYLVNRATDIFDSGHLGTAFISLEDLVVEGNADTGGAATGTMGGPSGSGYPGGGYPGPGGGPPPGSGSPFSFEDAGASFSSAGPGSSPPGGRTPPPNSNPAVRTNHNRLTRGFTFLGTATTQELIRKAEKEGYDMLVVFDVKVSQNKRSMLISNTCRAKIYALGSGTSNKPLLASKELNNLEVQKKSIQTEVEKAMSAMMTKLQETVALTDVPAQITSEMIKTKRLASITSDKSLPVLDALTEIKYWRYRGMIDDDEMEAAFGAIINPADAKKLVFGSESERIAVMKKYAK